MKRLLPILLAALVAAFLVPAAVAQYCNTWGVCVQMNPGDPCWGTIVPVCPTPTPIPAEGEILWRPTNAVSPATYVQGPWAVLDYDGTLYIGAHAGHCCPGLDDPAGWEGPFVMRWTDDQVTGQYPVISLVNVYYQDGITPDATDTHELGFGTMVRIAPPLQAEGWMFASVRSTKKSWIKMLETGYGNRVRGNISITPDPMANPYPLTFFDMIPTINLKCNPRNTPGCGDSNVLGVMMPVLVWLDHTMKDGEDFGEQLILYVQDPDGIVAWAMRSGNDDLGQPCWVTGYQLFVPTNAIAWSDIAQGDDGLLYALVSARDGSRPGEEACWWWGCRAIDEWVSRDQGRTWTRGGRSWSTVAGDLVNDGAYVRDPKGHIKRGALTVIALIQDSSDPTGPGNWRLHWWVDPGFPLPASWGHEPGWQFQRVRRHLQREPQLRVFVQP